MTCNLLINISTCELALLVYLKCVLRFLSQANVAIISNFERIIHMKRLNWIFGFFSLLRYFTEILISSKYSTWSDSEDSSNASAFKQKQMNEVVCFQFLDILRFQIENGVNSIKQRIFCRIKSIVTKPSTDLRTTKADSF